jgi:hypothetical protein
MDNNEKLECEIVSCKNCGGEPSMKLEVSGMYVLKCCNIITEEHGPQEVTRKWEHLQNTIIRG